MCGHFSKITFFNDKYNCKINFIFLKTTIIIKLKILNKNIDEKDLIFEIKEQDHTLV